MCYCAPPVKTSLEHLPDRKRQQITAIATVIQSRAPVEMIILFGSYARGDWVEDCPRGTLATLLRQAKLGRGGHHVDTLIETSRSSSAGANPARQRFATSRKRVLRGCTILRERKAAKRKQRVRRFCD